MPFQRFVIEAMNSSMGTAATPVILIVPYKPSPRETLLMFCFFGASTTLTLYYEPGTTRARIGK